MIGYIKGFNMSKNKRMRKNLRIFEVKFKDNQGMPGKNYPQVPAGNTRTRPYPLPDFLGRVPENFRVRVKSGNTRTRTREFPKKFYFSKTRYKRSPKRRVIGWWLDARMGNGSPLHFFSIVQLLQKRIALFQNIAKVIETCHIVS